MHFTSYFESEFRYKINYVFSKLMLDPNTKYRLRVRSKSKFIHIHRGSSQIRSVCIPSSQAEQQPLANTLLII